jgi:hypothetical protein
LTQEQAMNLLRLLVALAPLWGFLSSAAAQSVSDDFESAAAGELPPGWSVPHANWVARVVAENAPEGKQYLELSASPGARPGGPAAIAQPPASARLGLLVRQSDASEHRGKLLRISALLRTGGRRAPMGATRMSARALTAQGAALASARSAAVAEDAWELRELTLGIPPAAAILEIAITSDLMGQAAIDDLKLVVVGDAGAGDLPPGPLSDRGLRNLTALTRLAGYVRYFHPSDEAAGANWDRLLIEAVTLVEPAADDEQLQAALREVFSGIAPTMQVWRGEAAPQIEALPEGDGLCAWVHDGFGGSVSPTNESKRVRGKPGEETELRIMPVSHRVERELVPGLHCRFPATLHTRDGRTLPEGKPWASAAGRPDGWSPTGNDRPTRLASVMTAWNVLQHSYPYFDVVRTDWPAALAEALARAAEDPDAAAFTVTLARLIAHLHDGHGRVSGITGAPPTYLPSVRHIAGELIIATDLPADPEPLRRGDRVLAVAGRSAQELMADFNSRISAATAGWRRWRVQELFRSHPTDDPAELRIQRPDGTEVTTRVERTPAWLLPAADDRPLDGQELAPGIVYFNLNGADSRAMRVVMPKLEAARGIVFDMRGYPADAGREVLRQLSREPLQSARWLMPRIILPDREEFACTERERWLLPSAEPYLAAERVFLIDGRAISYAESCLGIVEAYKLGTLVGERTAGSNGNINIQEVPSGNTFVFTGLKVLKHDGSTHHGVGIAPDLEVHPTREGIAAGRDEILEKGVEVLKATLGGDPPPG